jgi:hypothetical protein
MPPCIGVVSILKSPVCTTSAGRGLYRDGDRVRYGVVYMDKLYGHTSEFDDVAGTYYVKLRRAEYTVLPELALDKAERHARAVYRHVDGLEKIRQSADMVLMAMGKHDALYVVAVFF